MTVNLSVLIPILLGVLALVGALYKFASILARLEAAIAKLEAFEKKLDDAAKSESRQDSEITQLRTEQNAMERRVARLEQQIDRQPTGRHTAQS